MRLDKLKIRDFKNLKDFDVDFDQDTLTTVLVGQNGAGKSNLLEALVVIFRDLHLGERKPEFDYEIAYECRGRYVVVNAERSREPQSIEVCVDGTEVPYSQFRKAALDYSNSYLPSFVFGYYSGTSDRMAEHFRKPLELYYSAFIGPKAKKEGELPFSPLFYAQDVHSQFVLLAFFLRGDQAAREFLNDYLRVECLDSVLFVMKRPPWTSKQGDLRFWKAKGPVQGFLSKLYDVALAPLRIRVRHKVSLGLPNQVSEQQLFLYVQGQEDLRRLFEAYGDEETLFKALESPHISGLLSEVRTKIRVRNVNNTLTFRELSEGEQQLLKVLGLLRFTLKEEALFLLDEPDTHLNPVWCLHYIRLMRKVVGDSKNSHVIMATHDPLVIAGLTRKEVQVMRRDADTGKVSAAWAEEDPKGLGIAGLLTSDVYGLRSTLDLDTLEDVDRMRVLEAKDGRSADEDAELQKLKTGLEKQRFLFTSRDPLYEPFVRAFTRRRDAEQAGKPVLTQEEQRSRDELADQIVAELMQEDERTQ